MPNATVYTETPDGRVCPEWILYLNVRRGSGSVVNGVLFVVEARELAHYDKREWVYERVNITADLDIRVGGGDAFVYVCRPEYCKLGGSLVKDAAVRASYVKIVERGLSTLGAEFQAEYNQSSEPLPQHLVIDDLSERQ